MRRAGEDGLMRGSASLVVTIFLCLWLLPSLLAEQQQQQQQHQAAVNRGDQAANRVLLTIDNQPVPAQGLEAKPVTKPPDWLRDFHRDDADKSETRAPRRFTTTAPAPAPRPLAVENRLKNKKRKRKHEISTAKPRPDWAGKYDVAWHEDTHYYALRASSDDRFRIRHAPVPEVGTPWPLPQLYQPSSMVFLLEPYSFEFHAIGETCDVLEYGFRRTKANIFQTGAETDSMTSSSSFSFYRSSVHNTLWKMRPGSDTADKDRLKYIHSLNVTVLKECTTYPFLEMDESYDLEIKRTGASIIAREVWGALRGLETFSQLVYQDSTGQFQVNKTYIHDYPRFPHRGILLDTARHYLNKETIIANLEAMAQNKMNVFHWHIVDDQSFPYQSKVFPDLTNKGAYDANTHVYSHEDIQEILEEARLRGIRVIPEFDTPGHTYSWGYGRDHLLTPCYDYNKKPDGYYGPINPILKATYRFLQDLFTEILGVFKDRYVHLGGDEVPFDCWYSNPFLLSFVKRNNLSDVRDLLNLYERKLLDIVSDIGRERDVGSGYIVWQEVFDNGVKLKPDTIVQVWSGSTFDIDRVTSAGYRTLFSSCWYLDYIGYGQDWDKYYRCDQIGPELDNYHVRNQSLLIGGEACLWTEYADDEGILPRLWPRASAAAERLWSNRWVLDVNAAAPRIEEQRCRMIRRGLPVGVLSGPGHCATHKRSDGRTGGATWWKPGSKQRFLEDESQNYGNVYTVDISAMYAVPLVLVISICCLALLSVLQDSNRGHASRLVAVLTYPVSATSKRGFRGLIFLFMVFVLVWCVWTAPMWMNAWEHTPGTAPMLNTKDS